MYIPKLCDTELLSTFDMFWGPSQIKTFHLHKNIVPLTHPLPEKRKRMKKNFFKEIRNTKNVKLPLPPF